MIDFINPALLTALIAAGIPLLLHLLKKEKTRKIDFSAVRFLKQLEQQRIKQVRLYQYLIILIRTLFIIFLVLTFARPTLSGSFWGTLGQSAGTAVVILDDSYSMQTYHTVSTYFDRARETLASILPAFSEDDKVFVVTPSDAKATVMSGPDASISDLSVTNQKTGLGDALAMADSLFRYYKNPNNELYIISDFNFPMSGSEAISSDFNGFMLPVSADESINSGIDSAFIKNRLIEKDKPIELNARLYNRAGNNMETALALKDSAKTYAVDYVSLAEGEEKDISLSFTATQYGPLFLVAELDEDDLSLDNRYYIFADVPSSIRVLFINDNDAPMLRSAGEVLESRSVLEITTMSHTQWQSASLSAYNLVVVNGPEKVNTSGMSLLRQYLANGRSIVLLPGPQTSAEALNLFGQNVGVSLKADSLISTTGQSYFSIESEKRANPLYQELFRNLSGSIDVPRFNSYLKIPSGGESLIRFRNNDTFLGSFSSGAGGNLLLFTASFDLQNSNILVSGLFLPLLYRVFYNAGYDRGNTFSALCGERVFVRKDDIDLTQSYYLIRPGGSRESIIPEQFSDGFRFDLGSLDEPGFYRILNDRSDLLYVVTVNKASGELNKSATDDPFFAGFKLLDVNDDGLAASIRDQRRGVEFWPLFLSLALLMLLLEMFVIYKLEGKKKAVYE